MDDRLMTRAEVVDVLALSKGKVIGLEKQGALESVRVGRAVRIRASSVLRVIRSGALPPQTV